jgi:sucrose-6-phosphate hydrolase SacC (GH32 family)
VTWDTETDLTRRFLLAASTGFLMRRWIWAVNGENPILCWKLVETGDAALESVSGAEDAITSRTGHATWVGSGRDRALRLDGYSVWIHHDQQTPPLRSRSLSIAAWLALESYPVDEAAIVQLGTQPDAEFRFSIDKWGYLQCSARQSGSGTVCRSTHPVPKAKWVHLAAACTASGTAVYMDGSLAGNLPAAGSRAPFANGPGVTLGKSPDCPVIAGTFPTGVLNGLLRDVRIFDGELSERSISDLLEDSKPDGQPDLQINGPWCADDPQRPVYHALPPRAWTNEPHGLIHWGGKYHLFYQKNPNGPYWSHINWGHMTSPDLYLWTEMPVALWPEPGPDAEGCWSGSVIDHDGKLAILYTGGNGHKASICLAESTDGIHFKKFAGNPVIAAPPQGMNQEFRDPFVWREADWYYLIIGSAVKGVGGTALLYQSKDLVTWEYRKPLLVGDRETSGVFWEMPIFVPLGSDHALIVCEVPGRASYWAGSWEDETFTPYSATPRRLELFNHMLSPTPMIAADGQVITIGIIPDERHPKECWVAGWAHLYSLPRMLSTEGRGRLLQKPHGGIERWREEPANLPSIALQEGQVHALDHVSGTCLHLHVTFRRGESQAVSLLVRRAPDGQEQTAIRYEWETGRLTLDRSRSSLDSQVKRDVQQATYFPATENAIQLEGFLDQSVLEVFIDDRSAFATRIYPTLSSSGGVAFECIGHGAIADAITLARINKPS